MNNQTLNRLANADTSVVTNPYFQHIWWPTGGSADVYTSLPSGVKESRYLSPGWYPFGPYPYTQIDQLGATSSSLNPFRQSSNVSTGGRTGVTITQYGPATVNNLVNVNVGGYGDGATLPGGLTQRIRRGRQLLGRQVRVTGSYRAQVQDSTVSIGMSLWLRGRQQSVSVSNIFREGTQGRVPTTPTATFEDPTFDFVANGVVAGDFLYVQGQWATPEGVRHPTRSYVIATVAVNSVTVRTSEGSGLLAALPGGDFTWAIASQSNEASFLGRAGIAVRNTTHQVGHVIRWTSDSNAYWGGEEWLNRAFDWLGAPVSDDGGGDVGGRCLMFGWPGEFITVDGASLSPTGLASLGSKRYLQAMPGGDAAAGTPSQLFYLDQETWADSPAAGNMLLHENTVAPGDATVQFFEEIIDIPDTLVLDNDDLFLILLPCAPGDVPSIDSLIQVAVYSLNIEVIPESDSDSVENRMVHDYLSIDPDALLGCGSQVRHYYQYPIYRPVNYPLNCDFQFGEQPGVAANGQISRDIGPSDLPATVSGRVTVDGTNGPMIAKQPRMPPGSVVVYAAAFTAARTLNHATSLVLSSYPQKISYATGTVGGSDTTNVVGSVALPGAGANWQGSSFAILRNKTGLWWPEDTTITDLPDEFNSQGAGSHWLVGTNTIGVGNTIDFSPSGSLVVLVDPRLVNSYWRND